MDHDDPASAPHEALRAIRSGEAELRDVLAVLRAANETGFAWAPERFIAAADALYAIRGDLANGGLDQVVWNFGAEATEGLAAAFSAVGAVELAALLRQLVDALRELQVEVGDEAIEADPIAGFLRFRRRVGGPDFDVVDPHVEVGEALREGAIEGAIEFPDPNGAPPPMRAMMKRQ